ncbi:glycosyltransferase family protein [Falsiroseomonas ponticola]|uniref:rhamnosyltransferase n=1 Tax=Falsiroseomonas ponticola TaxID=2786951 RepID=UPI0019332D56|nr:rhamnosyltransferase [Roseomonas ponticola]
MTAAGIVLFHPAPALLEEALAALDASVARVFLFLNAPLSAAARAVVERPGRRPPVLLGDGTNQGLGVAYNRMAAMARAEGFEALLLLDQDSSPLPAMAAALCATRARLIAAGECPAVVGPLPVAARGCGCKAPRCFSQDGAAPAAGAVPLEFVISSGSLIDLAAFEAVGGFREDFFIDAVDIEWCLRAWARHFSCWMVASLPMPHRLGSGVLRVPLLGLLLARQPPFRLYTHARNQMAMLRLPFVPLAWKCRAVAVIAAQTVIHLLASRERGTLRAFALGVADGLRARLGPVTRGFG